MIPMGFLAFLRMEKDEKWNDFVATVDVWLSKDIGVYKKQPKKTAV